jgi:hypothetical protein
LRASGTLARAALPERLPVLGHDLRVRHAHDGVMAMYASALGPVLFSTVQGKRQLWLCQSAATAT